MVNGDTTYSSRHVKPKLLQLVLQSVLSNAMKFVQREIGILAAKSQTRAVHVEHCIVQVPLGISKLAAHGPSSCDIRNITPKFLKGCQNFYFKFPHLIEKKKIGIVGYLHHHRQQESDLRPCPISLVILQIGNTRRIHTAEHRRFSYSGYSMHSVPISISLSLSKVSSITYLSARNDRNKSAPITSVHLELIFQIRHQSLLCGKRLTHRIRE